MSCLLTHEGPQALHPVLYLLICDLHTPIELEPFRSIFIHQSMTTQVDTNISLDAIPKTASTYADNLLMTREDNDLRTQ